MHEQKGLSESSLNGMVQGKLSRDFGFPLTHGPQYSYTFRTHAYGKGHRC